jgi:NAD(P)-dependent dehydrogenase (short-subunit alcohol dehydrogenase family)
MFHPTKGQHGHTVMALLQSPEAQRAATSGHALSRLGKPADIGAAVVFLSSEAASFITGQTLSVNGGDSMT